MQYIRLSIGAVMTPREFALFHERLRHCLAQHHAAGTIALLFVDLDRFKAVNDELSRPVLVPGGRAEVGASIGIALNGSLDDDELIGQADMAMYEAKRAGRGRFVLAEPADSDALRILKGPTLLP